MYLSSVPPSAWTMSVHAVRYSFISSTRRDGDSFSEKLENDWMSLK